MSSMFPTVNLLINLSSVAVLWLGADRVADGDLQVGSLVAYLSYLVQILMSVVMATFMLSMIPRASVAAGPHPGGARHRAVGASPPPTRCATLPARGQLELRDVGFHYPGAEHAVLDATSPSRPRPGTTTAIVGSTGAGKTTLVNLVPRLFDATSAAPCSSTASTCATSIPRCCGRASGSCRSGRTCSPAPSPATSASASPTPPRPRCGRRCEVAQADGLRAGDARRPRGPHRAGRHERLRRPAPAAVDRPGARPPAGDLPVRRLVLGPRPGHRRPPARRARAATPARRPS